MVFTTSICANYFPKALVLAKSIKKNINNAIFILCLVEREIPESVALAVKDNIIDHVVLAKDLGLDDDFNRFIFKHTIVEASTSVKGMLMKHLYDRFPDQDKFIYLDPDCRVYSDMSELWTLLDDRPIILCPHLMKPGHIDMEISSIKYGVYNMGFLAVNRMYEARRFIEWWAERLYLMCYDDLKNGLFTDQRWIDLAPTFFDVELLHHYGYDFGTWAVKDVAIDKKDSNYFINKQPLRFAHYSGYDIGTIDMVKTWWLSDANRDMYYELIDDYTKELYISGHDKMSKLPWSYARYDTGELISKETRLAYRNENNLRWKIDDPYKYSNAWFSKMLSVSIMKDEPKWALNTKKSIDLFVNEGIIGLLKKAILLIKRNMIKIRIIMKIRNILVRTENKK